MMLAAVSMIGLWNCGGDGDAEPSNQIKFDGKTVKLVSAWVQSELDIDDELGEYSEHEFAIASEGLTMSETGSLSGSGDMVIFSLLSFSPTHLKEGTYELNLNQEVGDVGYFAIYTGLSSSGLGKYYEAYRGIIKVSNDGDRYTITFDLDIFTSQSNSQPEEFVEGRIKGNYKGTVEVISGNGGPAKRSSAKGKKSFIWQ